MGLFVSYSASVALVVVVFLWVFKAARMALLGPMSKIPGPVFNRWSSLPLKIAAVRGRKMHYVHYLHQRYGPTVRTAPGQVDFSDLLDYKAIHKMGNGFLKSSFYTKLRLRGTLLCFTSTKEHAERRKYFSKAFAQQNLMEWDSIFKKEVNLAIANIKAEASSGAEADIYKIFTDMATNIVGDLVYGESFQEGAVKETLPSNNPKQVAVLNSIRNEFLKGRNILGGKYFLNAKMVLKEEDTAEDTKGGTFEFNRQKILKSSNARRQTFLSKALAENEDGAGLSDDDIVRESKAFIIAGTDTTSSSTTYLIWLVLLYPCVRARLQAEVGVLPPDFSASDILKLSYLQCVINEMLRLYGAVSSGLPRVVPRGGKNVGMYYVPEQTIVTTQSYTLHRDPTIFEKPNEFLPERWENSTPAMKEAFTPFGVGSRVCIGLHLAQMEISRAAVTFLRECPNAAIAPSMTDADMEPKDFFVVAPWNNKCMVVLN